MSWHKRKLGDCAKLLSGGTPKKSKKEYWGGDIPWVSSGEMSESFIFDTSLHVTTEGTKNGTRLVPTGTVLVVVRGMSLAKEFRISFTMREATFNQDIKALECAEGVDPKFLFYALKARKDRIRRLSTDASHGTKKLDTHALIAVELDFPETIDEQRRIAEIASAYDDLIENNRRRIALLERAARLLYREWFVHFRFPGNETARFVDSLPKGWSECSFAEMADYLNGFAFKPRHLGDVGLPIVKIPELKNGILEKTPRYDGHEVPEKYILNDGDLIFSWSGTLAVEFWNSGTGYLNQHLFKVTPNERFSEAFILIALRECMPKFMGKAVGATMKHIRRSALDEVKHPLPPEELLSYFNRVVSRKYDQVQSLRVQNQKLSKARDLLLPRLMDGRIPVDV